MSAKNLGVVFAPNVLRPRVETLQVIQTDAQIVVGCIEYYILVKRVAQHIYVPSDYVRSSLFAKIFGEVPTSQPDRDVAATTTTTTLHGPKPPTGTS